jgi:hypothetical protein
MPDNKSENHEVAREPEDLLEIVERIRSVPRVKPSRAFRARMTLYTYFPSLGEELVSRRTARRRESPGPAERWRPAALSMARIATAVALIIIVAFGVFGALTVAASNSQPGDALYSIKRFKEGLELTFTWGKSDRANKNLTLAQTRLDELDRLITSKKLDPADLLAVASDYVARRGAVEEVLQRDGAGVDTRVLASRLKVIKAAEANLEKRLAAAGPTASLAPASGAMVTVRDSSGRPTLGGRSSLKARTDGNGQVSFRADPGGKEGARDLEAYIELGERAEVVPVFPAGFESSNGVFSSAVEPRMQALELGQPQLFTMKLTSADGASMGGRTVRLVDRTGTGSINGVAGEVSVVADRDGTCTFTLTKNSLDRVSRVGATVVDAPGGELGQVLVVGGWKSGAGGASQSGVSVTSSGPPSGPQSIELSNGLVRLSASGSRPGYVVDSVSGLAQPGNAGPLYDPLAVSEGGAPADGLKMTGPRLTFANADAAGYQVDLETPSGLRKSYSVLLAKGNAYAVVRCSIGAPAGALGGEPGAQVEISRLAVPQGAAFTVSDGRVSPSMTASPYATDFQPARPYAVVGTEGSAAILACPVDSETYPGGWLVNSSYIAPYVQRQSLGEEPDASYAFLLGTGDAGTIDSIKRKSLEGAGRLSAAQEAGALSTDGFLVDTSPSLDGLLKGRQNITLSVYKQYEKILGR